MHISFSKNSTKTKQNTKKSTKNEIKKYLPGTAIGLILTSFSFISAAVLYLKINRPDKVLFCAVYALAGFAAFTCGYICQKKVKGRGIAVGAACSVPLIFFSTVFIYVLGGEKLTAIFIIMPFIQLVFSSVGGIVAANQKKRY